jgi:hypothetical protein
MRVLTNRSPECRSGSNAEAKLAALVQEYEAELPQSSSAAVRRSGEAVP